MALADWNIYKSNSGLLVAIDILAPILNTGSLKVGPESSIADAAFCAVPKNPPYPHGYTRGKLRSLIEVASTGAEQHGLTCMQSQENVTGAAGAFYALELDTLSLLNKINLVKYSAGLQGSKTTLATGANNGFTLNTPKAVEIEWNMDLAELGGVQLIVRSGDATDFSDLVQLHNVIDTTSPLSTTVGEGLYAKRTSNALEVRFDETRLDELAA